MNATDHAIGARCRRPARVAPPLRALVLPGLAGSPMVWEPFVARAPGAMEVWQADLPWTGEGDGRWSHRPDPVPWVVSAVNAVAPAVVIAHSFAAGLALEMYGRIGVRPPALVLVAPFYRADTRDFDWAAMAYYLNGFHRIIDEGLRVGSGRTPADVRESMALRVRDRIGPYGWMRFFDAYLRTPFLDTAAIDVPALVVGGERDIAAPPADARALAAALPAGRVEVLGGCGHFVMTERPDRFAELVHDFLVTALPSHRTDPESP